MPLSAAIVGGIIVLLRQHQLNRTFLKLVLAWFNTVFCLLPVVWRGSGREIHYSTLVRKEHWLRLRSAFPTPAGFTRATPEPVRGAWNACPLFLSPESKWHRPLRATSWNHVDVSVFGQQSPSTFWFYQPGCRGSYGHRTLLNPTRIGAFVPLFGRSVKLAEPQLSLHLTAIHRAIGLSRFFCSDRVTREATAHFSYAHVHA